MAYPVKLDVYEGPLDLLLQLVSKERVNVADISISSVTDAFLKATKAMGEVDLDTASSFLVLAATLLELKSLKLLPERPAPDQEIKMLLEERDRLLHRLIVYSSFKEASARLHERLIQNSGYHSRAAELPEELVPVARDIFQNLTPDIVAAAAARGLSQRVEATVDASHLTPLTVSLEEMIEELEGRLEAEGVSSFRSLCANYRRMRAVVAFLAVLELYRTGRVDLEQPEPFDPIKLTWRPMLSKDAHERA